jgi:hypothetical protein
MKVSGPSSGQLAMKSLAMLKKASDRINQSLILLLILVVILAFAFGYVADDLIKARQAESGSPLQDCLERALYGQHRVTAAEEIVMQRIAACIEFVEP